MHHRDRPAMEPPPPHFHDIDDRKLHGLAAAAPPMT
jgi:hypothetical protein